MRRPIFTYYGAKFRLGRHYPPPMHDTIVEPFAGSAGYSTQYWDRDVILIDPDEKIASTWRFLIDASPNDIRKLPLVNAQTDIRDLDIPLGAQYLIGYWSGQGATAPRRTPTSWPSEHNHTRNCGWSKATREHVAGAVGRINHWRFIHGSYHDAPDIEATWFVDPPYQEKGKHYRHGSSGIDYDHLSHWCQDRKGQVMVCENTGAKWLPFTEFREIHGVSGQSSEVVWYNLDNPWPQMTIEDLP